MVVIVAIDGPGAAGKGTVARRLAEHFGYAYLDTGKLYRAVAKRLLAAGADPGDARAAEDAARTLGPEHLADPDLRREEVARAAAIVAQDKGVRAVLLDFQRRFAAHPPGGAPGAVMDGRDIGTVVCPDAPAKLFVTAAAAERARRRTLELRERGEEAIYARVLEELEARDRRDSERATAPLAIAKDAHVLDTTELDADAAFAAALAFVVARRASRLV
ncbi:MAG: (d)CMP kinase [Alphaproteobacteria bacterium]